MPITHLITEQLTEKYRILVTSPQSKLSQEIIRQLKTHPQIETIHLLDKVESLENQDVDVILHVAGFENSDLTQTISLTSLLHSLLNIAKASRAKFYLIIPQTTSPQVKTAVTFITQFSKTYSLKYQVVEIVDDDIYLEAEAIIKKVIKKHRATPPVQKPSSTLKKIPPQTASKPEKEKISKPKTKPKPGPALKNKLKFFLASISVLLFPWFLSLAQVIAIPQFLNCSYQSLRTGQLEKSRNCSQISIVLTQSLKITSRVSLFSPTVFDLVGLPLEPLLSTFLHMSNSSNLASELLENYTSSFSAFLGNSNSPIQLDVPQINFDLTSLSEQLAYLQSDLRDLYLSSPKSSKFINPLAAQVSHAQEIINKVQKINPELPQLLAYNRKSTYLVLIQDNTELRATGGFIDSFILFTADSGRVSDIQIFSSSLADSRLKGKVEPPTDLKSVLGESSWYLRDSNWDPDFYESAQKAAWFVEKELSRPVDIVMAVNWTALQTALESTSSVSLTSTGSRYSSTDVLNQYIAQVVPTTTAEDQSLMTKLTQKIISSTSNLTPSQITSLMVSLLDLADSRQLLISPVSFKSDALQIAGWSGSFKPTQCLSQNLCLQDNFYFVHSNVGINKADYYIDRKSEISIDIKPSTLSYKLNINLQNTSTQNSWPAGQYRDYLRLYLPQNSTVDSVRINGKELQLGQYSQIFNSGQPVVGLVVEVAPSTSSEVEITAHKNVNLSDVFHYQVYVPNQPGLLKNPTNLKIGYPADWPATVYKQPSVASLGQLQYNVLGDEQILVDIDFSANK